MKSISSKEELKKALEAGDKQFIVTDKKLLKSLAVQYWIQNNKVKGTLLLAALPAAVAAGGIVAPIIGIIGTGLVVGGVTIGVSEVIAIGGLALATIAFFKGQKIESIDLKNGTIKFK